MKASYATDVNERHVEPVCTIRFIKQEDLWMVSPHFNSPLVGPENVVDSLRVRIFVGEANNPSRI